METSFFVQWSEWEGQRVMKLLFMTNLAQQISTWESKIRSMEIQKETLKMNSFLLIYVIYSFYYLNINIKQVISV